MKCTECIYQASRMTHTIHLGENVNINVFVYKKTALDMFNWDFWGQPVQQNISRVIPKSSSFRKKRESG